MDFKGKRALVVARISSPDSEMATQVEMCQRWAGAHGVTIARAVCDIAPAETSLSKRANAAPWVTQADLMASYDLILGAAPSRLFAGMHDVVELLDWAKSNAKAVVTADGAVDTTEPAGGLAVRMMAAFGDFEEERREAGIDDDRHLVSSGDVVTEYGFRFKGGSWHIEPSDEDIGNVDPMVNRLRRAIGRGEHVYGRRIVVLDDWEEITEV